MSLEELLNVKISGVVSKEQTQLKTPASVTVWDEAAIAHIGAANLSELVRFVPGFQLFRGDDVDVDSIAVRGRSTGSSSREVLMLVNGQRIDNWMSNSPFLAIGRMSTKLISRVEFIRGPASQLYGSNAFLGVINVVTKHQANDFQIIMGSHKSYQAAGNVFLETGQFSHQFNLSLLKDRGETFSVEDRWSGEQQDYRDPLERYELHYQMQWQPLTLDVIASTQLSEDYLTVGNARRGFNKKDNDYVTVNLSYELSLLDDVASQIESGFRYFGSLRRNYYIGAGQFTYISSPPSDEPLLGKTDLTERSYWVKINNQFSTDQSDYLLNLEWRQYDLANYTIQNNYDVAQLAAGDIPINYYGELSSDTPKADGVYPTKQDQWSLVAQYIRPLTEQTELTLGLRYDDYSDVGSNLSSRLALVHTFNDQHAIKFIYGEAFRAPTVVELYLVNNPLLMGDPDLDPETVKTTELVWNSQWANGSRLQTSLYYNKFIDPIDQVIVNGTRIAQNVSDTESTGIELMAMLPFAEHWLIRTSGSYLFSKPSQSFRAASSQANILLGYNKGSYATTIDFDYIGRREYPSHASGKTEIINSFWLVNATGSYELEQAGRLHLTIKNLTDKKSYAPTFNPSMQPVANRGIEFWLSYSKRY